MLRSNVVKAKTDHHNQAFQQTSKVRRAVQDGLDELKEKFGDIEDYLKIYSTKEKIVTAVRMLHITMLKATEDVIGYYTRHIGEMIYQLCYPQNTCRAHQSIAIFVNKFSN